MESSALHRNQRLEGHEADVPNQKLLQAKQSARAHLAA
jgi:hypothetical protein